MQVSRRLLLQVGGFTALAGFPALAQTVDQRMGERASPCQLRPQLLAFSLSFRKYSKAFP